MSWEDLLDEAELKWRSGKHHDALQLCDRAALVNENGRYHAALLRGDILLDVGDPVRALSSYESVADPSVPDPEVDCARGIALFEMGRFPEADNALRSAVRGRPDLAEAHFTLGLLHEILSTGRDAEFFRAARRLGPDLFPAPVQMNREEFEECIEAAIELLPPDVRGRLEGIPVLVQELPHPDDLVKAQPVVSPRCLGLFVGMASRASVVEGSPPELEPVVVMFKRNLERACRSKERVIEEIRLTLIHEVTHAMEPFGAKGPENEDLS